MMIKQGAMTGFIRAKHGDDYSENSRAFDYLESVYELEKKDLNEKFRRTNKNHK